MPNLIYKLTGKEPMALFTDAATAAKNRVTSNIATAAAKNPEVQADIKAGVGQEIGVWLIDNYKTLLIGGAALAVIVYLLKRR